MNGPRQAFEDVQRQLQTAAAAAGRPVPALLAVAKTKPAADVAALAACGQRAFGENYVQEGRDKAREVAGLGLEWHLIGHLQSNKCREAAEVFDWVQSLDRERLVEALHRHRGGDRPPLNVLIQVNVDSEASKSGCAPEQAAALARAVGSATNLRLRGVMGIGAPYPDMELRRASFRSLRGIFASLQARFPGIDTLSMGMSDDFELAVAEGATMVRIGSRLFGPR